jgi:structural maintenance of chromosome 4
MKLCKTQTKKLNLKIQKEIQKEEEAIQAGKDASESIPVLESAIQELQRKKEIEDEKLEAIFDEKKDATDQLRAQLETKTNQLAPLQQERAIFQASLDTAQTEASLLTDSVQRNQEQLKASEKELASLDECQAKKGKSLERRRTKLLPQIIKLRI